MEIFSNNIINGYLMDDFGHRGKQFLKGKPSRSFHIAWDKIPKNTESLSLMLLDHDAIPVCGFSWIHWIVANIDPDYKELKENASMEMDLLEGVTSWYSKLLPKEAQLSKEDATGYGGCAPPDRPHQYTLHVYALNKKLNLLNGKRSSNYIYSN